MAGYNGYSMSNNAVAAYANGEKPYSKWTKAEILAELFSIGFHSDLIKQLTVSELKALFLRRTSWHHTSSRFNKTDFYSVTGEVSDADIQRMIAMRAIQQPKTETLTKALVHYLTWEGTRKHPKAVEHTSYALLNDSWAFLPDGTKKKRTANGFYILEIYKKAPKGTAEIFKMIERKKS